MFLSYQLLQLSSESVDSVLNLLAASFLFARSCSSAHISCSEQIDVAFILLHNQIVKIFVIELLALSSFDAGDFVVVQIDADFCTSCVLE